MLYAFCLASKQSIHIKWACMWAVQIRYSIDPFRNVCDSEQWISIECFFRSWFSLHNISWQNTLISTAIVDEPKKGVANDDVCQTKTTCKHVEGGKIRMEVEILRKIKSRPSMNIRNNVNCVTDCFGCVCFGIFFNSKQLVWHTNGTDVYTLIICCWIYCMHVSCIIILKMRS